MPATITHGYFAKDLYGILPSEISNKLDLDRVMMFGQSTDSLIFYNLFSMLPGKDIRKFQKTFHNNKTRDFFINTIKYIAENNIDDKDVYSYLVGFICHYALDSTIHPYVVYKTGMFNKKDKSTYKYNNVHAFMEVFIDNDMVLRRDNTNPYRFKISKFCFKNKKKFSKDLNRVIDYGFDKTYFMENMSRIYYKSLKQMNKALYLFRRDRFGIKKTFYKVIDTFAPKKCFRFEAISYHYPLEDKHNYLNNDHSLWRHPIDYNITSNESFIDLYIRALNEAYYMITKTFDYLDGGDIDLCEVFLNLSYLTGVSCNDKRELKYFEY